MRILVLTPYFYPHPGGSQRYIEELYVTLRQLQPDLEVDILCYNTDHALSEEKCRGLTIYRVNCLEILPGQFAIPNPLQLIKVLKKLKKMHKYDVVNAHTRFFDTSWWTPLVAKYLHAKSILTDHCAEKPTHTLFLVNWITWFIDHVWVPTIARKYDQITVVSQATRRYLVSLGVKPGEIIYPGIDLSLFNNNQNSRQKDVVTISFVGRMISSKGPQIFLAAMSSLLKKYPKIQIMVAGNGPLLEELKKKYPQTQITFTGRLNQEEVARLLNKTDILVLPSTHPEGFPITILEAGAAECAVVTTLQGGTNEIIRDRETGLVIEPTSESVLEKVTLMLDEPLLKKRLAQNLHHLVKTEFTWEKSAIQFLTLLQTLS